jgi:hypothetical protein
MKEKQTLLIRFVKPAKLQYFYVESAVLTAAITDSTIFWDIMP